MSKKLRSEVKKMKEADEKKEGKGDFKRLRKRMINRGGR